jgi:hypothetical protein
VSTEQIIFYWAWVVVIIGMCLWVGAALRLAHTKIDVMMGHLKQCSAIKVRAPLRHGGPFGNVLLVATVSWIVTLPGYYLKRGGLSEEDLKSFPISFKRRLAVMQWAGVALWAAAIALWGIGEFMEWKYRFICNSPG